MPNHSAQLSGIFSALADPTRRAVVEKLTSGPAATLELAKPFRMALPSFLQHLDVLEKTGLVKSRKKGRVRRYELSPRALKEAEEWMSEQRAVWEKRLDQLDRYLLELNRSSHNRENA
jgi:DNA-binding transcriptional ArsR family regulator